MDYVHHHAFLSVPKVSDTVTKVSNLRCFAGLRVAVCGLCQSVKPRGGSFGRFVSAVRKAVPGSAQEAGPIVGKMLPKVRRPSRAWRVGATIRQVHHASEQYRCPEATDRR